KKCETVYKQYFPNRGGADVEVNGSSAVANGRVYFMTSQALYCIGKKDHPVSASANARPNDDPPADASAKPAHLQVFPADVALHLGEKVDFKARLYDEKGRFLCEAKADWQLGSMLPPIIPIGAPPAPKAPPAPAGAKPPLLAGELNS